MWKKIEKFGDFAFVLGLLVFIFLVPAMSCIESVHYAIDKIVQNTSKNPNYLSIKLEPFSNRIESLLLKHLLKKNKPIDTIVKESEPQIVEGAGNIIKPSGGLSEKIEGIVQNRVYKKYAFVNLNGIVFRFLGMNSLNNVQKLRSGILAGFSTLTEIQKVEETSQKVVALNKFLTDRGIPFLFLMIPSKSSIYDVQFAPGYGENTKQDIANMIHALSTTSVKTINIDDWYKNNGWRSEDVFFKTDHHWKPEAGLATVRCAMDLLQREGIAEYGEDKLREESYRKEVLKDWFLGSQGKRTGQYFAGVDDITIYHPNFETNYFYAGLRKDTTDWEFSESVLDLSYTEKKDYFRTSPYSIYMHRDYPLRITINSKGQNNKRLLLVGRSFKMMPEYFLTTQFREVYTIDLRYYTDGTFAQYVAEIKPDVVIMYGDGVSGSFYDFNVESYLASLNQTDPSSPVQSLGDFELRAEENNNDKFVGVCGNLEANQAYTLTVDRTALSGVEHSFVQMTLQNLSTNKAIFNRYFESNCGARQKWIFTTPEKVEDAYGIFLYAGTKGHTAGIDVKVEGINLRKGIFED